MEEWPPESEILLLQASSKLKPVGIHKHMRMFGICTYINNSGKLKYTPKQIWERLSSLYDLDFIESLQENDTDFIEFFLPQDEFEELLDCKRLASRPSTPGATPKPEFLSPEVSTQAPLTRSRSKTMDQPPKKQQETPVRQKKQTPRSSVQRKICALFLVSGYA